MLHEHLRAWSSRVLGKKTSFQLGKIDPLWTQRYAVATDDLNPLYFDADYARSHGYETIIAPPNYLATLRDAPDAGPFEDELLEDGTRADGRPDVPGLQIMGGGQELFFSAPVYCGDDITVERHIENIETREGRSGQIVIVTEELRYFDGTGRDKLVLKNKMLYRYIDTGADHDD